VQVGCCPPGWLPPPFVQDGGCAGVILAAAGVASDETSIDTDSVTAIAASAANVTLLVFMSNSGMKGKVNKTISILYKSNIILMPNLNVLSVYWGRNQKCIRKRISPHSWPKSSAHV
jgi:hypothetical protein